MANEITVYTSCRACGGTGIDRHAVVDGEGNTTWVEQTCAGCSGVGDVAMETLRGGALDDILDKLDDCLDKLNDIKEKIDEL